MFKPNEVIICVDIKPHKYNKLAYDKWPNRKNIDTITKGNKYDVVSCTNKYVTIINDRGYRLRYRVDRFKSLTKDRKSKIKKLKSKIKECSNPVKL